MHIELTEDKTKNPYHSLIDANRINILEINAVTCCNLPGAAAEIGVYHGGSLVRIAKFFKRTTFYGIDTFEGLPEPLENIDIHRKGDFSDVDFDFLTGFFKITLPNVRLIKGVFPEKKVIDFINDKMFSFVHVDVDLYQSTKDCLVFFVPKLALGGVLIVDDYGFKGTPGAKKAVDEYITGLDLHSYDLRNLDTKQFKIQRIK